MVFLILCVLMNVGIFSLFNLYPRFKVDTFQAIVTNYLICVVTGFIFTGDPASVVEQGLQPWMLIAFALGGIFIGTFYLMAITTQKYGISVSSIASKISLAIPVVFSLFIFNIESKVFNFWNYLGLISSLFAIYFSSYRSGDQTGLVKSRTYSWLLLPILIFISGGIIDTTINYTNYRFLSDSQASIFPIFIFISASIIGIIALLIQRRALKLTSLIGGLFLGVVNYFSVFFLLKALSSFQNDGAVVYPVLNMMIILGSAFVSVYLFRDKLEPKNKFGFVLSLVSIFLIFYQEILAFIK